MAMQRYSLPSSVMGLNGALSAKYAIREFRPPPAISSNLVMYS